MCCFERNILTFYPSVFWTFERKNQYITLKRFTLKKRVHALFIFEKTLEVRGHAEIYLFYLITKLIEPKLRAAWSPGQRALISIY